MRAALLCLFLIFSLGLFAQQNSYNQPQNPAQPEATSESPQFIVPTTPQAGHPLDPHDVDVLTGKSSTAIPASARAVSGGYAGYSGYYPYSANVPLFTGGQFNSTRGFTDQRFFRNFGLFNPRGFLFFGSGNFGLVGRRGFGTQATPSAIIPGR